jgi:GNAT superfamily N-acetyltransferase
VHLENRVPTVDEHRELSLANGWEGAFDWDRMQGSLDASLAGVVAVAGGTTVGMGRLVGDGVKYFYVQDMAVLPDHHRQGIGGRILDALLDHVRTTAPDHAFVGLFATGAGEALYRSRGFDVPGMTGLGRIVSPAPGSA